MKCVSRFAMLVAAASCLFVVPPLLAQPGGGPGGFRGGPGGLFGGGGMLGLLQQQEVQGEIELNDDQADELRTLGDALRDQIRDEMQGAFQGMRDLSDEERQSRFEEIRSRVDGILKNAEGRVQEVLLPHQFERLKQIDLQARIQRGGAAALTEGELAETLGLTEAQREHLRERSEQVEQEMQAKIRQLRLDARNQLMDVLTAEQRARLESMMGQQFDVPDVAPPGGPGQRGGRFGFGGRGGRNRGGDRAE
jgi:Spy/CpxP family protein refolding chaperone